MLAGCASPTAAPTAPPSQAAVEPTPSAVPTAPAPTATPSHTPTSTATTTATPDPTSTPILPTPTPIACSPLVLDLPFYPDDVGHTWFIDGGRQYGIYWFDLDPTEGVRDWRGLQDSYDTHRGTDFCMDVGSPVLAAADGKVVRIAGPEGTGVTDRVVLDHGCGYYTGYHHIAIFVSLNEDVTKGQQIAIVATGPPTPHLHFELEHGGLDQCQYLRGDFGCPMDVMIAGFLSEQALSQLYKMPEVQGFEIPD